MKAKVTGVSAWQGTPTGGTLDVEIRDRYVDSSGNATVSHYSGKLDPVNKKWLDPQTNADLWLIVQGPDDPPGPRAVFREVLAYGPGKSVTTTYTRRLISSDLDGLIFDYADTSPVDPAGFGDAPLTMRAAGQLLEEGEQLHGELRQSLVDTAQTREEVLAQQQQNNAQAALAAGRMSATSVATMGTTPGLYTITSGPEVGWVVERKVDGDQIRRPELEAAPAPQLFAMKRVLEATTAQLRAGNLDVGSMTRIWDEAGPLDVVTNAQGPAVDNTTVFQLAGGKKAVRDYTTLDAGKVFGFRPKNTATQNTAALTWIADWQHSNWIWDVPNAAGGGALVMIPPGKYRYGDHEPLKGNVALRGTHFRGAYLFHEGVDHCLLINGRVSTPYTDGNHRVAAVDVRDVHIESPNGKGVFIGSSVNPMVHFKHVELWNIGHGYAWDTGDAVYNAILEDCVFSGIDMGIRQAAYCDQLTLHRTRVTTGKRRLLTLEGPTARIIDNNFEGCLDPLAMVYLLTSAVSSSHMLFSRNRYGAEAYAKDPGQRIAPFDVAFLSNLPLKLLEHIQFIGEQHLSSHADTTPATNGIPGWYTWQKEAPMVTNIGLGDVQITGHTMEHYKQGEVMLTTGDIETVKTAMPLRNSVTVDRISNVSPQLDGFVQARDTGDRRRQKVMPNAKANFPAFTCASYLNNEDVLPLVQAAKYQVSPLRRLAGIIVNPPVAERMASWMDLPGGVIRMPGLAVPNPIPADPRVWVGADGLPTLTMPAGPSRQIGELVRPTPAEIRIRIGERIVARAMPTSDSWVAGELVDKYEPVVEGAVGSRYVVTGWRRLTTGSGHVLGVDWVERREMTGT